MQNILITGGAGFIGTNLTAQLLQHGHKVVVVDDFKNAYIKNIKKLKKPFNNLTIYKANCCNVEMMENIVKSFKFDVIIHLAAKKYVFESFKHPKGYMHNNLKSLDVMLALASKHNIKKFAFASTVAVYGETTIANADETQEYAPTSPYAKSKQLGEQMILNWQAQNKDKASIIFRFTNPISANTKYMLGNNPKKQIYDLPSMVIDCALNHKNIKLNGNNHKTKDGTPVRDYIHITDLTHIVCEVIEDNTLTGTEILNIGCGGKGYSVLQIVRAVETATNTKLNYSFGPKKEGDIAYIVCNNKKLICKYGKQNFANLSQMINDEISYKKNCKSTKNK